jgi:hypothetical protein
MVFFMASVSDFMICSTDAYLSASLRQQKSFVIGTTPRIAWLQEQRLFSTTSASSDADFSAFADSLDMEDDDVVSSSASSTGMNQKGSISGTDKPWQVKLEELLDPATSVAQRQVLLSELLNANEKIRESVMDALTNRKVGWLHTACFILVAYGLYFATGHCWIRLTFHVVSTPVSSSE